MRVVRDRVRRVSAVSLAAFAFAFSLTPSPAHAQSDAAARRDPASSAPAAKPPETATSASQEPGSPGAGGGLTLQGAGGAGGQGGPRGGATAGRPSVSAVRAAQPPTVDGRLDDAIWRTSAHLTKFVQRTPLEGAPASEQTDVYIAYDSQKLYFGVYAHYSDRGQMRANRVDRDKTDEDDTVTVSLDPLLDQQTGYSFSVNGYGVQADSILNRGASGAGGDGTWNALFSSAGQLVEDGWTAEMAIPFKSLRYPARGNGEAHRWGFQIEREIKTKYENDVWSPISRGINGYMQQMGVLEGMTNLSTSRNFELLPNFTATRAGSLNTKTGVYTTDHVEQGGTDVKFGLTPNLTLDFTYNPDFSQIESDTQQITVNQRFAIQYPELRPFFLEGAPIFAIGGPAQMTHTRTIVDPKYGAKLTGKVGRTSVGFLLANDEAPGNVDDPADRAFGQSATALIARARFDYGPEQSVGALFTNREFLNSYSRLGGIDARFRFGQNRRMGTFIMFSQQRDLTGVEKHGHIVEFNTSMNGRHVSYMVVAHPLSPGFGTDLGFVRRVNWFGTSGRISYKWWPENGWLINWAPEVNLGRTVDYSRVLQNADSGTTYTFAFKKNINLTTGFDHNMERYREIDFVKNRFNISGGINMSRRILFTGSIDTGDEIRFIASPYLGKSRLYTFSTTFRPVSRLQSVLKLTTSRFVDPRTDTKALDVKILRSQTTYQFTPRLLVRNITEFNSGIGSNHTLFQNILVTYRVNSGTAFYVGYDDRYKEGDIINAKLFPDTAYHRTNRAIFTKVQYLFRSGSGN